MRKKKLIEQNAELFGTVEQLRKEIATLKQTLGEYKEELERLQEPQEKNEKSNTSPFFNIKERIIEKNSDGDASEYGAKAIGRVVVAVAEAIALLPESSSNAVALRKENLLGRSEIVKGKILDIVFSSDEFSEKKTKIDNTVQDTIDYINAQKMQVI